MDIISKDQIRISCQNDDYMINMNFMLELMNTLDILHFIQTIWISLRYDIRTQDIMDHTSNQNIWCFEDYHLQIFDIALRLMFVEWEYNVYLNL